MTPVVILWAGCGRRISSAYGGMHKALIHLNGEALLDHLLRNVASSGCRELVPIVGYQGDTILSAVMSSGSIFDSVIPVDNPDYERTNNLGSLLRAREVLEGRDFTVVNGDMVFDPGILAKILSLPAGTNAVAADLKDYGYQLDSPRVLVENGRITDIGRHRTIEEADGYAVGIYRFGAEFSKAYFDLGDELLKENPNAGYHDVLPLCLDRFTFIPCSTDGMEWMDVDEPADVTKAEAMLRRIEQLPGVTVQLSGGIKTSGR